ncbi:MAG: sulfite exporter TauE/SafE family protein [Thermanaeromonas sp.]|uniref:sulfite exporter TauE/SafE family protein n=1 Tax=Thermanaeromonas sp. TaxID=2003697 RepID=UPI0024398AFB|nr:sulfite exporter TauE/SafE family protein [Thermanaeromonas sp.]MCG0277908.1 sulfite exporter TauE/SafE family protein [Thermanaeromonas sp.]
MYNFFTWLAAILAVFIAGALQGITGFGFALIAVPLLLLVFDARMAIALNLLISFSTQVALSFRVRQGIIKPLLINLFQGSLLGLPLGLYIFLHFDVKELKIVISILTIGFALLLLQKNIKIPCPGGHWVQRLVGSLSGFLTTSIGVPGPPVILFLNTQGLSKDKFRATSSAYFTLLYPVSLVLLASCGGLNLNIALTAFILLPFAFLGSHLGIFLFPRIPQKYFRQGVPLLVIATGIYSLFSTLF